MRKAASWLLSLDKDSLRDSSFAVKAPDYPQFNLRRAKWYTYGWHRVGGQEALISWPCRLRPKRKNALSLDNGFTSVLKANDQSKRQNSQESPPPCASNPKSSKTEDFWPSSSLHRPSSGKTRLILAIFNIPQLTQLSASGSRSFSSPTRALLEHHLISRASELHFRSLLSRMGCTESV